MQLSTTRRIATLRDKIPDIQKTLDTVLFLKTRTSTSPPLRTTFSLSPTLYAHAIIPPPRSTSSTPSSPPPSSPPALPTPRDEDEDEDEDGDADADADADERTTKGKGKSQEQEVYLWLGANIMLAYPICEAEDLLREKLDAARSALGGCEEDVEFLREQVTVRSSTFFSSGFFCLNVWGLFGLGVTLGVTGG